MNWGGGVGHVCHVCLLCLAGQAEYVKCEEAGS